MSLWPEPEGLEGRGEIYLQWKTLGIIAFVILIPLIIALLVDSLIIKIICGAFSLLSYMSYLRVQGPCVMAIAVIILPWYIYLEWQSAPKVLLAVPIIISLIEISFIRHRMRYISEMRKKEDIIILP